MYHPCHLQLLLLTPPPPIPPSLLLILLLLLLLPTIGILRPVPMGEGILEELVVKLNPKVTVLGPCVRRYFDTLIHDSLSNIWRRKGKLNYFHEAARERTMQDNYPWGQLSSGKLPLGQSPEIPPPWKLTSRTMVVLRGEGGNFPGVIVQ